MASRQASKKGEEPSSDKCACSASQAAGLPLTFFRVPVLRLGLPSIPKPSAIVVFSFLFLTYFLVLSGIVYDFIVEPPSIGATRDPATGAQKPVAFLEHRINGQYLIEGFAAGLCFSLGGLGFIFLDRSSDPTNPKTNRLLYSVGGAISVFAAFFLSIVFLLKKVPDYLVSY